MSTEIKEILRPYRCFINPEAETVAAIKALIESKCKEQRESIASDVEMIIRSGDFDSQREYDEFIANIRAAPSPKDKKQ